MPASLRNIDPWPSTPLQNGWDELGGWICYINSVMHPLFLQMIKWAYKIAKTARRIATKERLSDSLADFFRRMAIPAAASTRDPREFHEVLDHHAPGIFPFGTQQDAAEAL